MLGDDIPNTLIELITTEDSKILQPALRIIGNILSGPESMTKCITESESGITNIMKLIDHENLEIKKEALWMISNVTAETGI